MTGTSMILKRMRYDFADSHLLHIILNIYGIYKLKHDISKTDCSHCLGITLTNIMGL